MSYIKSLFTILKSLFTILKFSFKTIIVLLFVGSLAVNIIMMTWSAGAFAIGGAFTAITGVTSVVTGLGNRLNANKKAVSKITKRVAKRTIRGTTRNVLALPAESIPGAGAAVAWVVTFWELYDACQTMKDIKEISRAMDIQDTPAKNTVCGMELPSKGDIIKIAQNSPNEALDAVREFGVDIFEDVSEGIPEDVREDIPEDVREDIPEDIPEDVREDTGKSGNFFRKGWESVRKYFSDD